MSPQILDSIIGIDSYNLGLDGSPFIPQKALFELYKLNNKKPKVIVQVVSNGTLRSLDEGFLNPIKFAPYLNIPIVKKQLLDKAVVLIEWAKRERGLIFKENNNIKIIIRISKSTTN